MSLARLNNNGLTEVLSMARTLHLLLRHYYTDFGVSLMLMMNIYKLSTPQASLLGEAITGKGILAQLNLETGVPIYEAEPLLLFFILFNLLGAIGALGDRGRFVDDNPGIEGAVIPPGKGFRSALGLKEGGYKNISFYHYIYIYIYSHSLNY